MKQAKLVLTSASQVSNKNILTEIVEKVQVKYKAKGLLKCSPCIQINVQ